MSETSTSADTNKTGTLEEWLGPRQSWREGLKGQISALAGRLAERRLPMADHAALRRMDPTAPGRGALAMHRLLVDAGIELRGDDDERRWALLVHAIALARGRHSRIQPLGVTLANVGMSEARINTLLAADIEVLEDLVPRMARRLNAAGAVADWVTLAHLILNTGRDGREDAADAARFDIARAYAQTSDRRKGT
jgi:hypothetical protein